MFLKKFFVYLMLFCLAFENTAYASVMPNMSGSMRPVRTEKEGSQKKEYKYKTVLKHYKPYLLTITNNNSKPVLLRADSEVLFLLEGDEELISKSRRCIYKKSRKRDVGRYNWFALPGAVIAGGVTGITLFLGAPIGFAIAVGTMVPANKAVRANVDIAQDMFVKHDLPIRMEPKQTYEVRILVPKKAEAKRVEITNVSFDMKKMYDMSFPVVTEEKL